MRVLITGGGSGIGRSLAIRLTQSGAKVALIDINPAAVKSVATECGSVPYRQCDIGNKHQVATVIESLASELGGFDVVVANAGIAIEEPLIGHSSYDADDTAFEKSINVNVLGTFHTIRAAYHFLNDNGYMIVTSSLAADVNLPLMGGYSASKSAVSALGNTLQIELKGTGHRVGVAYYSQLDNEMTKKFDSPAAKWIMGRRLLRLIHQVVDEDVAIDALVRAMVKRSSIIVAPRRVRVIRWLRSPVQSIVRVWVGDVQEGLVISRAT